MKIAYNNSTGEIVACGTHIDHMSSADISLIEGSCNPGTGYINNNEIIYYTSKELVSYANRPNYSSYWDNSKMSWVDNRSLDEIRIQKYSEIKNMAAFTDVSSIEVNGYIYTADKPSREVIVQKLFVTTLLNKESEFIVEWFLKDGTSIDLSFYQLKGVLAAIESRSDRIFKTKKELKNIIFAADAETVNSIRWPDFI